MITSMLLEIPNLSENKCEIQKKVISKNFRKLIEQYDLKGIQFVPSNSRDFIVFAARNLHLSKWQEAFKNICSIKIFKNMPEFQVIGKDGSKEGPLKLALMTKFKEVALKIFIIETQPTHESYSLKLLQDQFELDASKTVKIISKMIAISTISARID